MSHANYLVSNQATVLVLNSDLAELSPVTLNTTQLSLSSTNHKTWTRLNSDLAKLSWVKLWLIWSLGLEKCSYHLHGLEVWECHITQFLPHQHQALQCHWWCYSRGVWWQCFQGCFITVLDHARFFIVLRLRFICIPIQWELQCLSHHQTLAGHSQGCFHLSVLDEGKHDNMCVVPHYCWLIWALPYYLKQCHLWHHPVLSFHQMVCFQYAGLALVVRCYSDLSQKSHSQKDTGSWCC